MTAPALKAPPVKMTRLPCLRCLDLARDRTLDVEMVQPLPAGAWAPMGLDRRPCCFDCASADTLVKLRVVPTFEMARVAVGNDRIEHLRLPLGIHMGLVLEKLVRPSEPGDLERHHAWLDENDWFGCDSPDGLRR